MTCCVDVGLLRAYRPHTYVPSYVYIYTYIYSCQAAIGHAPRVEAIDSKNNPFITIYMQQGIYTVPLERQISSNDDISPILYDLLTNRTILTLLNI